MVRIAIIGSRNFNSPFVMNMMMRKYLQESGIELNSIEAMVSGGADGADTMARHWALNECIEVIEFLPNYEIHGKAAPFIRNELIIRSADIVFAFWDGSSPGTAHALHVAEKLGKEAFVYFYNTGMTDHRKPANLSDFL